MIGKLLLRLHQPYQVLNILLWLAVALVAQGLVAVAALAVIELQLDFQLLLELVTQ
jgi:hypothetical protein